MKESAADLPRGRKICPDCRIVKSAAEFSRNAAQPDGLQFHCKECFSIRAAATYRRKRVGDD